MRALRDSCAAGRLRDRSGTAGANIILHGGKVVTVDSGFSIAQAVAVRGDRIVAVGDDARDPQPCRRWYARRSISPAGP